MTLRSALLGKVMDHFIEEEGDEQGLEPWGEVIEALSKGEGTSSQSRNWFQREGLI